MAVAFSTFSLASISFANSNINGNKIVIAKTSRSRTSNLNKKNFRSVTNCKDETLHRSSFPEDFLFGASTSALQIESSARDGGRGESTLDSYLGDGSAARSLYKYNEDILCLKNMGMDVYRFSISWPRLFPHGKVNEGNLNQEGLKYYKTVFKLLKLNNIQPIVSIFHFELPKVLEDNYGGTLSPQFEDDFKDFADFCFTEFGETVKHWITINEPQVWSAFLYPSDTDADTVPATPIRSHDLGKEPYIRAFHLLNAHAKVFSLYKTKYKGSQGGMIGMSLNAEWFVPYSSTRADKQAAVRAWDFMVGWFLDPLVHGDYPCSMKHIVKERLPLFTDKQMAAIKGSFDFIGINYYMSHFAKSTAVLQQTIKPTYSTDQHYTAEIKNADGKQIGPLAQGNPGMPVYPEGLKEVLLYLKSEYDNPIVYITENGYPQLKDAGLNDEIRKNFIQDHLNSVLEARNEGSKVGAYCVWNLMDCVEYGNKDPYGIRFGLNFVDFDSDYSRIPKKSAEWFREFLTTSSSPPAPSSEAVISLPTAKVDELESLQV